MKEHTTLKELLREGSDKVFGLSINGEEKQGFWADGLFIVPGEAQCYYQDMNNEWRVIFHGN